MSTESMDEEWKSNEDIRHRILDPGGVQEIRESWGFRKITDRDGLPEVLQAWLGNGVTPYQLFLEMRLAKMQQAKKLEVPIE